MSYTPMPSLDKLFTLFYVDSTSPTGLRHARDGYRNRWRVGDVAGSRTTKYASVRVNGVYYTAHRIIHKMRTGEDLTDQQVDHRDRNHKNNHPFNLRWLSTRLQHQNTTTSNETGLKGVYFDKRCRSRPYRATIWVSGKAVSLGYYATAEEAHTVYKQHLEENL